MLREKANVVITEAGDAGGAGGGVGGLLSNLAKPAQDAVKGAMQDSGTKQTENAAVDPLKLAKSFF
ncbi:hypothetical protein EOD39_0860 [Acipenser ruthenus]|uniref:Uncharacterized protein n=1 Tax=Acipenser ruthenus TaxID=7906 RepID=A0A444UKY6_ACIRT|nr:hypothetical protein EOD39_0860 [Acipenser ruthenus]